MTVNKFLYKTFKAAGLLLLLIVVVELLHFSVLANPQKMFAQKIDLGRYKIYSDIPISADIIQKIFDADERVSQSELFDSTLTSNIFICDDPKLYSIFPFLTGMGTTSSGLTISAFENIFLNLTRIKQLQTRSDPRIKHSHLNGEFSQILAHELTHQLITNKLGFWEARNFPRWKTEGYCEYNSTISQIRKDSSYSFRDRCRDYFENGLFGANRSSTFYYKSQLIVEYLFESQKISFEEFCSDNVYEAGSQNDLLNWYKAEGND